jgi:outer membrane protein OmpA-like peptidoglycan-associated protein
MNTARFPLLLIVSAALSACAITHNKTLPDPNQRVLISGAPLAENKRMAQGIVGEEEAGMPLIRPKAPAPLAALSVGKQIAAQTPTIQDPIDLSQIRSAANTQESIPMLQARSAAAPVSVAAHVHTGLEGGATAQSVATSRIAHDSMGGEPTRLSAFDAAIRQKQVGIKPTAAGETIKNTLDKAFASKQTEVRFAFATSVLGPQGKREIAQIAELAKEARSINLVGATDASGDHRLNQLLALARAHSVGKELASHGVPQHVMLARACATSCATSKTHEENRRVDIELIVPTKALAKYQTQPAVVAAKTTNPMLLASR